MVVYLDDTLTTGRSEKDQFSTLDEVLKRLQDTGLRLKKRNLYFKLLRAWDTRLMPFT